MKFKKLFNTWSNSAALKLVAKHSHKRRPSMISWRGYWNNKSKTVSPPVSTDVSAYKAEVQSLR